MFDHEVNQFSTAAKLVHLHHLILMEFDNSRRNRKLASNLEFLSGRDVNAFAPSFTHRSALSACLTLVSSWKDDESPAFQGALMATTNSSEAECLTTKPKAPP
jgi:hypothetical protein